jgi:hypothetical protein
MSDPKQDEVPLPVGEAEVLWHDHATNPFGPRPGKIIDASLAFMDSAPIGTRLYSRKELIAYGNARARAATERAAQVCREAGVTRGHGHITPRADGVKARCGGPAFCKTCQREQAANEARWKVVAEVQRQFAPVLKAAIELLCAVDAQHEKEPPLKYTIPYGAVNNLRSALVPMSDLKPDDSADAGIKGDGR